MKSKIAQLIVILMAISGSAALADVPTCQTQGPLTVCPLNERGHVSCNSFDVYYTGYLAQKYAALGSDSSTILLGGTLNGSALSNGAQSGLLPMRAGFPSPKTLNSGFAGVDNNQTAVISLYVQTNESSPEYDSDFGKNFEFIFNRCQTE